jgi:hypothetical protein
LKEAEKLGFTRAWIAPRRKTPGKPGDKAADKAKPSTRGLVVEEIAHLQDLVARLAAPESGVGAGSGPGTPARPGRARQSA